MPGTHEGPARGLLAPGGGDPSLNPTLGMGEQEDQEFKARLGDMGPLSQKKKSSQWTGN